jgi:hypothetical protein
MGVIMKYLLKEEVILVGDLTPNSNVTIKLIDIETDKEIPLETNICKESKIEPGIYLFSTKNIDYKNLVKKEAYNIVYVMSDEYGKKSIGKVVIGGLEKNYLEKLYYSQYGSWKISDKKLFIFDDKGNEIAKFALLNKYGQPDELQVYERKKI